METMSSKRLLDDYGVPYSLNSGNIPNEKRNTFIKSPNEKSNAILKSPNEKYMKNVSKLEIKDSKSDNEKIYVCVRKRPLNMNEIKRDDKNAVHIKENKTVVVNEQKLKLDLTKYINYHSFTFDYAFDSDASNQDVYNQTGASLIEHVFNGGTATYFCYGQTGSGKTFTMMNPEQGLFILAAKDIFKLLKKEQYSFISVYISFYEIYQGQLYDLLNNKKKVYAREDNNQQVCIQGLSEYECFSEDELMSIFMNGRNSRVTSTTGSNPDSSRSHGIFQVILKDKTKKNLPVYGKFIFIDLAGSERGADRDDTDKQTLLEGQEINKSLLALKECIRAIDQESKHTPFRQSKLTQVLKDSFIGNSKTCMITTISPSSMNIDHTLNTLRYAHRVKEFGQEITTSKAIVSEISTDKSNKNKLESSKLDKKTSEDSNNNKSSGKSNGSNSGSSSSSSSNINIDKKDKKNGMTKYSKLPTYQHYTNKKKNSNPSLIGQVKIKNVKIRNSISPINSPVITAAIEKLNLHDIPALPPISKSENDDKEDNIEYYNNNILNGKEKMNLYKSKSRSNSPEKTHVLRRKIFSSGDVNSMIPTINRRNIKNTNKNIRSVNKRDDDEIDKETIQAFSERLYSFSELKEYENALFSNIKKRFDIEKGSDGEIPLKIKNHESLIIFNELINNTEILLDKKIKLIKEIKTLLKSKSSI